MIIEQVAKQFDLDMTSVKNAMSLFDEGKSLHFIARYRKNKIGNLSAEELRKIRTEISYQRNLTEKRTEALTKLKESGEFTDVLKSALDEADRLSDIDEIMAPYRSKRQTRAKKAREKGLQPIADIIMGKKEGSIDDEIKSSNDFDSQINSALDIVAEESINHPRCKRIAEKYIKHSKIRVKHYPQKDPERKYENLLHLDTKAYSLSPHQVMALFRAEDEGAIKYQFRIKKNPILKALLKNSIHSPPKKHKKLYIRGLEDGVKRLLIPRATRSIKSELKEKADERAIEVFKENLENLLLQPPIMPQVIMGIDPGYVNGCKVAVINEFGELLDTTIIYPTKPKRQIKRSGKILEKLINKFDIDFIAIGNGTGSQETQKFVRKTLEIRKLVNVNFAVIPETGASVYSASTVAHEEFPNLASEMRGAISIARRVLDPLTELVKIDPKSLGVGQYQHDVNQKDLEEALEFVMKKAVNKYGLNIHAASKYALQYIAGIGPTIAERIIEYRDNFGFQSLQDLYAIHGIGEQIFEQCAGFLRLYDSQNLLDQTLIHPEYYKFAQEIIDTCGKNVFSWEETTEPDRKHLIESLNLKKIKDKHDVPDELIDDIINELILFGRDPRGIKEFQDYSKQPQNIEELEEDMILNGEVRNVVDFGCFVDIGLKQNGLVHISNMADRYVSNTHSIVQVGDAVKVKILDVDRKKGRIGLKLLEVNGTLP